MKKQPLVTIVTITFNLIKNKREKTFRQCLESVHNQTYENIEHIIIDGASTDGTIDLIKEYADKGWITYISEPDTGIYDAMNKGIKKANGKYIAFLNSDDYYHGKDGVAYSVSALEESGADFSYAPVLNYDEYTKTDEVVYKKISNVFFSLVPCHQSMFFRKDVLVKEGMFNLKYKYVADYDMTIRLCLKKYKSIFVDNVFLTYRLGGYSMEATNNGLVFKEVSDIYYQNYNKLCDITKEESERMCGDIYGLNYRDIPLNLAEKLREIDGYFNYSEYKKATRNRIIIKIENLVFLGASKFKFAVSSPKIFIRKYWHKINK